MIDVEYPAFNGFEKVFWGATYRTSVKTWRRVESYLRENNKSRVADVIAVGLKRKSHMREFNDNWSILLRFRDGSIAAIDAAAKELDLL